MSVYIFSQPKAGTYFLADLIARLGFRDTGFHVMRGFYLDTKSRSLEENSQQPGLARVPKFFVPLIRSLDENDMAYGHFSIPLNADVAPKHMKFVCAYRDPKRALVSEFIDFRFRRTDLSQFSPAKIPDDGKAFVHYLKRRGLQGHYNHFREIMLYRGLLESPVANQSERERAHFVNFDDVLADASQTKAIAKFLGVSMTSRKAEDVLTASLSAETKTKAEKIDVDRDALWSRKALRMYEKSRFPDAVDYGRSLGLTL